MTTTRIFTAAILVAASLSPIPHQQSVQTAEVVIAQAAVSQVLTTVSPTTVSVKAGKLVKLDFGMTEGEVVTWWLPGGNKELFDVANDGATCYFSTEAPGTYFFARFSARHDGDKIVQSITEHVVTVTGATPAPPTPGPGPQPPTPPPGPTIPPENDKLGLATLAYTQCVSNLAATDKAVVQAIADGYAAVNSQIAAGTITTVSDMNAKILAKNQAAVGTQKDRYGNALIVPLAKKVSAMGFKTPAEHRAAFDEIIFGLNLFAK